MTEPSLIAPPSSPGESGPGSVFVDWQLPLRRPGLSMPLTSANDGFAVTVEDEGAEGQVVISVAGELDVATAPSVRAVLDGVEEHRPSMLIFELSELEFMDSTGVHVLVTALARQRARNGVVVIQNPRSQTVRVLTVLGLSKMLTIVETTPGVRGAAPTR